MADNYLEKKYEEYKSRKSSGAKAGSGRKAAVIHKTRRVFVTGGAEGIGKAIVKAFRSAGHRVAFCDRNEAAGKETALQTGTSFFHVDVSDREALENCMQQIFKEWGDIDIVINNAGISCFSPITETSVEDFDRILSVNLRPVFITSRRLAIHRQSQESPNPFGRIVNICSTRYLMSESGSRRVCGIQRRHLFADARPCTLACRVAYHGQFDLAGLDRDARLRTASPRRPRPTSVGASRQTGRHRPYVPVHLPGGKRLHERRERNDRRGDDEENDLLRIAKIYN